MVPETEKGTAAQPCAAGAAPVPAAEFRALMSGFPTGVAVVTAMDEHGEPHGLTCTSLTSCTVTPPVLMTCLDARSGTLAAALSAGCLGVNLLHTRGLRAARIFSSHLPCRFDRVAWRPSGMLGTPWLTDDAFARAECLVAETFAFGDHVMVLGKVMATEQSAESPLLYGRRRFSAWAPEPRTEQPPNGR